MTTFHTDDDLAGAQQFPPDEGTLQLATEITVGVAGTATFRWRFPNLAPGVTPAIRVWDAADNLHAGPLTFATTTPGSWNSTSGAAIAMPVGTYRITVTTDRYVARTGFYSGGPITRGDLTGVGSRVGTSTSSPPTTVSTATFFVDIDFTADTEPEPEPEIPPEAVVDEPRAGDALHLARVMQEIALACSSITGLSRFYSYPPPTVVAPAGYVSYPARVLYHQTYGRGEAGYEDLPIVLVVGKPSDLRARDRVAEWSAADGPRSVIARLADWRWESCDDVTVMAGEFDIERIAGIDYLALILKATVVGPGKD